MKPRLLDLFCGAGGAAMGYARAGFDVIGVDIEPQPNYPFRFVRVDALELLAAMLDGATLYVSDDDHHDACDFALSDFSAIHASPPCQAHTTMSNRWRGSGGKADSHSDLIPATRDLVEQTGLPYVIENVPGARADLRNPVRLTGEMFGLRVHRPRWFETNWLLLVPPAPSPARDSVGVYGKAHDGRLLWRRRDGSEQRAPATLEEAQTVLEMPWADWRGCAEAIPPAYTELIGHQLLLHLEPVFRCADPEGDWIRDQAEASA